MKKFIFILILFMLIINGCSSKEKEVAKQPDVKDLNDNIPEDWQVIFSEMIEVNEDLAYLDTETEDMTLQAYIFDYGSSKPTIQYTYKRSDENEDTYFLKIRQIIGDRENEIDILPKVEKRDIDINSYSGVYMESPEHPNYLAALFQDDYVFELKVTSNDKNKVEEKIQTEFENFKINKKNDLLHEVIDNMSENLMFIPIKELNDSFEVSFNRIDRDDEKMFVLDIPLQVNEGDILTSVDVLIEMSYMSNERFEYMLPDNIEETELTSSNGRKVTKYTDLDEKISTLYSSNRYVYENEDDNEYIYSFQIVDFLDDYDYTNEDKEVMEYIDLLK